MLSKALDQIIAEAEKSPAPERRTSAIALRGVTEKASECHDCYSCTKAVWALAWDKKASDWNLALGVCNAWMPITMDNLCSGPFFCTAFSPEGAHADAVGSISLADAQTAGRAGGLQQPERRHKDQEALRGQRPD